MIKLLLRPATIFLVVGLLVGLLMTGTATQSHQVITQTSGVGSTIGHVLISGITGMAVGLFVEIFWRLLSMRR